MSFLLLNVTLVSLFSSLSGRNQAVGLSVFPTTSTFSLTNNQATIFIAFIPNQVSFITSNTIIYYYLVVNYLYSGLLRGAF